MTPLQQYLNKSTSILQTIAAQEEKILQAATWFSETILAGRMVHVFGSGHSRIMVEEMWPRYGSFPGFNPIVELSLTYHNNVVGPNGQRQAMFLENVSGLAERILRNFTLDKTDTALVISSSGTNIVPVEMAEQFRLRGIKVVALVTAQHSAASSSKRPDGKKLSDFSDLILDTGAPAGDSMVQVTGLDTPVSPGSTLGGVLLINGVKAELARLLTEAGHPPKVLTASCIVGEQKARELFESAYDEHALRLSRLYNFAASPPDI
jgi:uncharacterized phosphosugar-binding protein